MPPRQNIYIILSRHLMQGQNKGPFCTCTGQCLVQRDGGSSIYTKMHICTHDSLQRLGIRFLVPHQCKCFGIYGPFWSPPILGKCQLSTHMWGFSGSHRTFSESWFFWVYRLRGIPKDFYRDDTKNFERFLVILISFIFLNKNVHHPFLVCQMLTPLVLWATVGMRSLGVRSPCTHLKVYHIHIVTQELSVVSPVNLQG